MIAKTLRRYVLLLVTFAVSVTLAQDDSPSGPPKELAHLKIPTGKVFRITSAERPVETADELKIGVTYSKPSGTVVQPDGLAVVYFTPVVQLNGIPGSLQSAQDIINQWRKNSDLFGTSVSTQVKNPAGEVAGGVALLTNSKDGRTFSQGGLGIPLKSLKPQVVGLILMNEGKPLSDVFWLRLAERK